MALAEQTSWKAFRLWGHQRNRHADALSRHKAQERKMTSQVLIEILLRNCFTKITLCLYVFLFLLSGSFEIIYVFEFSIYWLKIT